METFEELKTKYFHDLNLEDGINRLDNTKSMNNNIEKLLKTLGLSHYEYLDLLKGDMSVNDVFNKIKREMESLIRLDNDFRYSVIKPAVDENTRELSIMIIKEFGLYKEDLTNNGFHELLHLAKIKITEDVKKAYNIN